MHLTPMTYMVFLGVLFAKVSPSSVTRFNPAFTGGYMSLLKTPLHAWHLSKGAKMAGFAGWDMPIQYSGIIAEHLHTREHVGLFDICHMGEIIIEGKGAAQALGQAFAANVEGLKIGRCRYGFLLTEEGGIIDDLIIYRLEEEKFMAVVNAGCRAIDFETFTKRLPGLTVTDISDTMGKIDVQGPEAVEVMEKLIPGNWRIPYFSFAHLEFEGTPLLISRTGYTGELGFELYVQADKALALWELCLSDERVLPVGLGARDTLRLEVGLPLNGQDVGPEVTPSEAGYGTMLPADGNYVGKEGSLKVRRKLVPLTLEGRRSARHGDVVLSTSGEEVGTVSSGSFAPSLGYAIAFAHINVDKANDSEYAIKGAKVNLPAKVVEVPFYTKGTARTKFS